MTHANRRLHERTRLPPEELARLRRALRRSRLSPRTHHYRFPDGSVAVLKPVRGRHVVATVLSRDMRAPGQNVVHLLKMAGSWCWLVRRALRG